MDILRLETAARQLERWHKNNPNSTRLQKHETMKAILFGLSQAILEYKILKYHDNRSGLIDYVDNDSAIEIDDGPNVKSIRKLAYIREQGKQVYWILILTRGLGGKARRIAMQAMIPTLRILIRSNHYSFEWIS